MYWRILLFCASVGVVLTGCAQPVTQATPAAAGWTSGPITDEATYRREIVGRPLTNTSDNFVSSGMILPDGTMTVETRRRVGDAIYNRMTGTWRFENGQACRDLTVVEGSSNAVPSECQSVAKTGDEATFTGSRGSSVWKVG